MKNLKRCTPTKALHPAGLREEHKFFRNKLFFFLILKRYTPTKALHPAGLREEKKLFCARLLLCLAEPEALHPHKGAPLRRHEQTTPHKLSLNVPASCS